MHKNTPDSNLRPLAIGLMILAALVRVVQNLNFAPVGARACFAVHDCEAGRLTCCRSR